MFCTLYIHNPNLVAVIQHVSSCVGLLGVVIPVGGEVFHLWDQQRGDQSLAMW